MSASHSLPMLRLVSARVAQTPHQSNLGNAGTTAPSQPGAVVARPVASYAQVSPAHRTARENAAAARLDPDDMRFFFAQEAARRLEGDTQAILRPQRRRDLQTLATKVGLRPFDANLVIAIVQDAARHDESQSSPDFASRLAMVRRPRPVHRTSVLTHMLIAVGIGLLGFVMLIAWLFSGTQH